ncbi:MAG: acyl-CoA dehydrogenase family protein [Deltaproteobacteria bacterium]|nr:acyl-CoA dehydrogenase family protein [Deltaproteobacteria bacterium]
MIKDYNLHFPPVLISEQEQDIHRGVRDFVDREIMPIREELEEDPDLQARIRRLFVDMGLQKLSMPKAYGGEGIRGTLLNALISEELSRGDVGLAVSHMCTGWAWKPAMGGNMQAVLDAFMPAFCGNEVRVACFSITEPGGPHGGGGCDLENPHFGASKLRTRAAFEGGECIINGSKLWATNSGIADLYCLVCTTDPRLGEDGIVLAYVPKGRPGLTVGPDEDKCGLRTDHNCPLYLDDVRIPREWTIGPGGKAAELFRAQLPGVSSGAMATGVMQGVLETVLEYTGQRIVADRPIREHGGPAETLAEIAMSTEMARTWYVMTAYMCDHPEVYGPRTGLLAARMNMARITSEHAVRCAEKAIQLMGSYGYVREYHVEKYWRDSLMITLWKGGTRLSRHNVCRGYYDLGL